MTTPLFIHINSCGGRYVRAKLCEKYNNDFFVHHINPKLWRDIVPREKVVRFWRYRSPKLKYNTELQKYNNISIYDTGTNVHPFIILRNPIVRYLTENKNEYLPWNDTRSHDVMCKSIYVAITGDYNSFFDEFNEEKFEIVLEHLKHISVITLDKIYKLENIFNFNTSLEYKPKKEIITNPWVEKVNMFDCRLYKLYA